MQQNETVNTKTLYIFRRSQMLLHFCSYFHVGFKEFPGYHPGSFFLLILLLHTCALDSVLKEYEHFYFVLPGKDAILFCSVLCRQLSSQVMEQKIVSRHRASGSPGSLEEMVSKSFPIWCECMSGYGHM